MFEDRISECVLWGGGGGCAEKQLNVHEGQKYGFPIWLCLHSNYGSDIYSMTLEEWYMLFKASVSSSEKQRLNRLWASKLLRRSVCRVWGESETYGSDTKQCKMFLFVWTTLCSERERRLPGPLPPLFGTPLQEYFQVKSLPQRHSLQGVSESGIQNPPGGALRCEAKVDRIKMAVLTPVFKIT